MQPRVLPLGIFGIALLLTGCGVLPDAPLTDVPAGGVVGTVFGGQQPVVGATVTVWLAGTGGYGAGATSLATTTTVAGGSFAFSPTAYTCAYANAPVYITAQGGNPGAGTNANLVLAAGLGSCSSAHTETVNIDEVTTVATAYALQGFFTTTLSSNPSQDYIAGTAAGSGVYNTGLVMANTYTIPNLINLPNGTVKPNTATLTIDSAKIYSLANTLAACVNSTGQTSSTETTTNCGKLFNYTKTPGASTRPSDTFQAAVQMARYPYQNVANLYNLAGASAPFVGLATAPNDLTIGVSYKSTTLGLGINGAATIRTSSNLDIDASGKVWFPTNASAAHGVAYFDPTSQTFNGPYSTGLVQPQYVAIDMNGLVWATDQNSSALTSNSTTAPTTAGTTIAVSGSTGGGPLTIDLDNSVLFSYVAGGSPFPLGVLTSGAVTTYNVFTFKPTGLVNERVEFGPSGAGDFPRHVYAITEQGGGGVCDLEEAYVSSGSPADNAENSGVATCFSGGGAISTAGFDELFSVTTSNQLFEAFSTELFTPTVPLSAPEGIATDGSGNEWIANSGSASVSTLGYNGGINGDATDYTTTSTIAYLHDSTHGATMTTPYGIGVDRSGNVWVSNASCVTTTTTACTPSGFTLSELIGAAAPTITPVSAQGINTGVHPSSVVSGGPITSGAARRSNGSHPLPPK